MKTKPPTNPRRASAKAKRMPAIEILAAELTPDGSGYCWLSGWRAKVGGKIVDCMSAEAETLPPRVLAEVERRAERFARRANK